MPPWKCRPAGRQCLRDLPPTNSAEAHSRGVKKSGGPQRAAAEANEFRGVGPGLELFLQLEEEPVADDIVGRNWPETNVTGVAAPPGPVPAVALSGTLTVGALPPGGPNKARTEGAMKPFFPSAAND